jgi:3-hydroxybutyryl-CoA dehydrogenase
VWHANVVDIMPHAGTDPAAVEQLVAFARRIDQVPIVCRQERHGYVFNAMLQSFLQTALTLHTSGVASFQDVDRAWMGVMKTPIGPFGILDRIGLDTVHDIASFWVLASRDAQQRKILELLGEMTAVGRLGVKTGWGFYRYPHPEFERAGFLQGQPTPFASAEPGSSERS